MKLFYRIAPLMCALMILLSCKPDKVSESRQVTANQLPDSLATLNGKIMADSANPRLYNLRSIYYLSEDKINLALNDINRALSLDPLNIDYILTLSDVYLQMGNSDEVISTLHHAIDLYPQNARPYLKMGEFYVVIQNYRLAFDYLDKAIGIDNSNPDPFFMKGFAFLETGDTIEAVQNFQYAVDKDQNYTKGWLQLGNLMLLMNNQLAINYYQNALDTDSSNAELMYMVGFSYQHFGMIDRAKESYNSVLKADTTYFLAAYNLGYLDLMFTEDFQRAIKHFSAAVEMFPDYVDAYYNRGLCYEILGEYVKARDDYQKTINIQTNYQKGIEGLNRLDN